MTINLQYYSKALAIITIVFSMFLFTKTNAQWSEVGGVKNSTFNNSINSLVTDSFGNLYAAGAFKNAKGKEYVAKWNGSNWIELGGTNSSTFDSTINCLALDANGNLYAAGAFTNGTGFNFYVAMWNGSSWSELGGTNKSKFNNNINSLITDSSGNVYAAGAFTNGNGYQYIARWNGNSWSELGGNNNSTFNGTINSITIDLSENIFAAGKFWINSNNGPSVYYIAKWNGSSWVKLLSSNGYNSINSINCLTTDARGNINAAGYFYSGQSVWKWDGNSWMSLGDFGYAFNNYIYSLTSDVKDNMYAAGSFTNGNKNQYVAQFQWNASSWTELGGTNNSTFNSNINCIITDIYGNVYASGAFTNGSGKHYVAKYTTTTTPVSFTSFTAQATKNNSIIAIWQTATELNNGNFIIEHSTDGISYKDIGTVKAIGIGANSYSYTDYNPANEINYYRLQSVDKDGSTSYSNVVSVNFEHKQSFSIVPNPASDFTTISFSKTVDKATIEVYDVKGKQVITQTLNTSANSYKLNTQSLKSGLYVIKVNTATGNYNEKLLINK